MVQEDMNDNGLREEGLGLRYNKEESTRLEVIGWFLQNLSLKRFLTIYDRKVSSWLKPLLGAVTNK